MQTPLSVKLCTEHGDTESDSLCAALKLSFPPKLVLVAWAAPPPASGQCFLRNSNPGSLLWVSGMLSCAGGNTLRVTSSTGRVRCFVGAGGQVQKRTLS